MPARRAYSAQEQEELWRLWRAGERITDIARRLGREAGSIYTFLLSRGGIRPSERKRSSRALSFPEREQISRGLSAGQSLRSIARRLGRAPSTISREVARNGGQRRYRATRADARAAKTILRPKPCKLATSPRLRARVESKLRERWSPEQIAGWLKKRYPGQDLMHISHESIYRSLFVQARGALKRELLAHLRTKRRFRGRRKAQPAKQGQIVDAIPISARPAEVEDRAVPGHWEGDLLVGSGSTQIATLVERTTRFTLLVRVPSKDAATVRRALGKQMKSLPAELKRSLTWDRGTELAEHAQLSVEADLEIYFCNPRSPWQRGTNENTNRLLRDYFPKGTRLDGYSQSQLSRTAQELNMRPRKTLGFQTPAEAFSQLVALTR
ncbi:MAG: IS30 family transposase [Myxococcota bacterium]